MRLRIVWIIFMKEILETVRDRRTLLRILLLPTVIYPLLMLGMTKLRANQAETQEERPSSIAVWGDLPPDVEELLLAKKKFTLEPWKGASDATRRLVAASDEGIGATPTEDAGAGAAPPAKKKRGASMMPSSDDDPLLAAARQSLAAGDADAILVVMPAEVAHYRDGGSLGVVAYVDSVRDNSNFAAARLESAFERVRGTLIDTRERARGLPEGWSRPAVAALRDTAPGERRAGYLLGMVIPVLLFSMALLGVFLPAIDLTAGEKERGTLETLLCAPVTATEIMAGKFFTAWAVSLMTAAANVGAFALTVRRVVPEDLPVPLWTYGATFLLLVPLTALFSGIFLAVAAFAKDFKDGQNVLMPVYLPCTLLGAVAIIPGIEIDRVTVLVPVVNVALLIKAVFLQRATVELAFLTAAATSVHAAIGVAIAARVFASEEVLLGGKEAARGLLSGKGIVRPRATSPSPTSSLLVFAVVLAAIFHGSAVLASLPPPLRMVAVQAGFILAPALGVALVQRLDLKATFALRRPPLVAVFGAFLLGASAWTIAVALTSLVPVPKEFIDAMTRELALGGAPLPVAVLVLGVLPAVCEEMVFRGFVFGGLRRLGPWPAILGSSLLFGVAHASIYRMLPTVALGGMLGYCRERTRSLWPGVLFHATNNALLVSLGRLRPDLGEATALPKIVYGVGVLVVVVGLVVVTRSTSASAKEAS